MKSFTLCAATLLVVASSALHAQTPTPVKPVFSWAGSGGEPQQFKSSKLTQLTGKVVRAKDPGGWLYALQPASGPTVRITYEGSDPLSKALGRLEESGSVVIIEGIVGRFGGGYQSFEDAKPMTIRVASGGDKSVAAAQPAPAGSPLGDLERQLSCEGSYQKDIGKRLVAARLATDKQYTYEFTKGAKLFGLDAVSAGVEWDVDPGAKVTLAALSAKLKDVRAALAKAGVNLNRKSAPFVVVAPLNGGSSTLVACAWEKPLAMP